MSTPLEAEVEARPHSPRSPRRLTASAARWVLGVALLATPLVPMRLLFGHYDDVAKLVPPAQWLLGAGIAVVLAWLSSLPVVPARVRRTATEWGRGVADYGWSLGMVLLVAILVWVSWSVFQHRPLMVDSIAQLFQAKIFASGHVAARTPADPAFFMTQNVLFDSGRWYTQYPPGQAALLAIGVVLGAAWLVPIVLSLIGAAALYGLARRAYDGITARVTLALLVLCPFFWFMGASFMNHVSSLAFIAVFLWLFAVWEDSGMWLALAGAGAALGIAFLSRPYTVAAVAAPFAVFGWTSARRHGRVPQLVAGLFGFLAVASLLALYNDLTTGNPLLLGYVKHWGASHGLGFHATPWGGRHTPALGLRNELTDLQLLNLNLFEWPLPALWPLGLALLAGWLRDRWSGRLLVVLVALPAAYFFYWHRDSYLGPRFLYAGIACAIPLTARVVVLCARRLGQVEIGLPSLFRRVSARRLALSVIAVCFGWSILVGIPGRQRVYASGLRSMKVDLPAQARKAGIERGLVFIKVAAGSRLIARLRGLGAAASTVEKAYRRVDFCDLLAAESRARSGHWSTQELNGALSHLIDEHQAVVRVDLNGDPTFRLRRDRLGSSPRLPEECRNELAYDQSGYGVFPPFLLDDRPDLTGPLLVAMDQRGLDTVLEAHHPDLPAYLYYNGQFRALGPARVAPVRGVEKSATSDPSPDSVPRR